MLKVLKWIGIAVGALILLIVILGAAFYVRSNRAIGAKLDVTVAPLAIPADSASVSRGEHLVTAVLACGDCHGQNLAGNMAIDAPPFMRVSAANLTRGAGGVAAQLSDADWVRAIRHGLAPDGHKLVLMPAEAYRHLSDADLAAVIAYAKSLPPVNHEIQVREFGPIARLLLAQGKFPLFSADLFNHDSVRTVARATPGVTVEYGRYLANAGGCTSCHGPNLSGGPVGGPPDTPPASNVTPSGIGSYAEEDFFRALREGKRPSGQEIDPFMPWRVYGHMTDDEIRAIWAFLKTVPPRDFGNH